MVFYWDLGEVGLVIEGAIVVEGFGVIGVGLAKWVGFEGPSLWFDSLFPWGTANFGSNLGFGQLCWTTVKGKSCCLGFSKVG